MMQETTRSDLKCMVLKIYFFGNYKCWRVDMECLACVRDRKNELGNNEVVK